MIAAVQPGTCTKHSAPQNPAALQLSVSLMINHIVPTTFILYKMNFSVYMPTSKTQVRRHHISASVLFRILSDYNISLIRGFPVLSSSGHKPPETPNFAMRY